MPKYRVTFTETVEVEADNDREAQAVAEETIYFGTVTSTEDVQVERV